MVACPVVVEADDPRAQRPGRGAGPRHARHGSDRAADRRPDRLPGDPAMTEHTTAPPRGLWGWLTTTDHKKIGKLDGVTAMAFFVVGGLEALFIRLQLATPNREGLSA